MSPWMLAVVLGTSRAIQTQTFTANGTWVAPVTTSSIETASGKGAAGTPDSSVTHYYHDRYTYRMTHNRDGSFTQGPTTFVARDEVASADTPLPDNYASENFDTPSDPVSDYFYIQYIHFRAQTTTTTSATTGASTTGFGKTFPGGSGGAASLTNFANVPVTPGASYAIVVPAGGTLTITYYQ